MNLKLPVDVHLAVAHDGTFALLVGGLDVTIKPTDLSTVMGGKPLRNGPRPRSGPGSRMCRYGDARAMAGKKLCRKHQAIAVKSVAKARAAKKAAAA